MTYVSENPAGLAEGAALQGENGQEGLPQNYFFPPEMIGGSSPQVKGEEESLAWQAAAEACDSERIHFVWNAHNGRVWYLAVRSQDLASEPQSWCPFTSLLPGMPDAQPSPVIYTYYSDEAATLMAVERDSLQIIRGTNSVVRAKAERMAREMGNAAILDLVPDVIVKLAPVRWESLSMLENRARRFMTVASVLAGIVTTLGALFIWFIASVTQLAYQSDLASLQERTKIASVQLQQSAMVLRTSEMREQVAAFNRLNEQLINMQGWLKLYMVREGKIKWWAVVPPSLTAQPIQDLGAQTIETLPEGLVIANSRESYLRKNQIK